MNKSCSKCSNIKDLEHFHNDKRYSDGKYPSCKQCKKVISNQYYSLNKSRLISQRISKHIKDLQDPRYRAKHNEKCSKWNRQNPKPEYMAKYNRERRARDTGFRIAGNLRSRLYSALQNNQKVGSAVKNLGCSIEELKKHLESQFQPGMTWENYGNTKGCWNIDHIIPLSKIDLSDTAGINKACHYNNLQPMWWKLNIIKSNR